MNIAVYKDQRYEFMRNKDGEIVLLSNTWQQDFEVEEIEGMKYYTAHTSEEETEALWETDILMVLEKGGQPFKVMVADTHTGDIVEFLEDKTEGIPDILKEQMTNKKEIPFSTIKNLYPDVTFRKVKTDYYDGSTCSAPIPIMEAISYSIKMTKISAKKTILECGNCGFHFPYSNAGTPFGEVYRIECPMCGAEIVKMRN